MDTILHGFTSQTGYKYAIWPLVLVAFALGFGARFWLAWTKPILEHDEAISLMEASGSMDEVAHIWSDRIAPYMTPTPAATWQKFMQPERTFIFNEVGYGANQYDRQPPFYYWALHIWLILFGSGIMSAVSLNLLLDALTTFVLYRFAREFFERPHALLVVILWLLSPIALYTALFIRSYSALTLASVCFAYASYMAFYKPEPYERLRGLMFVAATVFFIGIHFYAIWLVGAAVLAVALRWAARDFKRILLMGVHLLAALLVMLLIQPSYFEPFLRNDTAFTMELSARLEQILLYSLSFVLDEPYFRGNLLWVRPLLVVLFVIVPLVVFVVQRFVRRGQHGIQPRDGQYIATLAAVSYFSVLGMYLAGMTPLHYRYFSYVVPFTACLLVLFLHLPILRRFRSVLGLSLAVMMVISAILTTRIINGFNRDNGLLTKVPDGTELVIINVGADNHDGLKQVTYRGHALQAVYNLPPQTRVIIGHLDTLLDQSAVWLPEIAAHKTTLLLGFPNEELFALIEAHGYTPEPFHTYMYYTDTRRIVNDKVVKATVGVDS